MSDESRFLPVEEKLQGDARRLLAGDCQQAGARLWSEHLRRRRRRAIARSGATMVAMLVASVVGIRFAGRDAANGRPAPGNDAIAANTPSTNKLVNQTPDVPVDTGPPTEFIEPQDIKMPVVPFVVKDPTTGEEILSGFYVPERIEPVDLQNLSPAERDAVRAVLGIEEETPPVTAI